MQIRFRGGNAMPTGLHFPAQRQKLIFIKVLKVVFLFHQDEAQIQDPNPEIHNLILTLPELKTDCILILMASFFFVLTCHT